MPFAKERYSTNEPVQTQKERPGMLLGRKSLLEQITAYVETNLEEKLTLKRIADQFGVSVSTVTQLFQKKTGSTFHHFVTRCRVERARTLILQGLPLEAAGREVGYRDHSTFYRAFRQYYGISPREFRKNEASDTAE